MSKVTNVPYVSNEVKIKRGQIWTVYDVNNYVNLYMIVGCRLTYVSAVRISAYHENHLFASLEEIILYKESKLRKPSIPLINTIKDIRVDDLKNLVAECDPKLYKIIISVISDYMIGNIDFDKKSGKMKYAEEYNQQFRAPSRLWVYNEYIHKLDPMKDKLHPTDINPNKLPDHVKIVKEADKQIEAEDVKKLVNKFIPYATRLQNQGKESTMEAVINEFVVANKVSMDLINQITDKVDLFNTNTTSNTGRKPNVMFRRGLKTSIEYLNKEDIIFILTMPQLSAATRFGVSISYIGHLKAKLKYILFGEKREKRTKTIKTKPIQEFQHKDILDRAIERSASWRFSYTNPRIKCDKYTNNGKFTTLAEVNLAVDKYMYDLYDKIGSAVEYVTISDLGLTKKELAEKYNIKEYVDQFYIMTQRAFNARKESVNIKDQDLDMLEDFDKLYKFCIDDLREVNVAVNCIRRMVNNNIIHEVYDKIGVMEFDDTDSIIDIYRKLPVDITTKFSDVEGDDFVKHFVMSAEKFKLLVGFIKSLGLKYKSNMHEMFNYLSNSQLYYIATEYDDCKRLHASTIFRDAVSNSESSKEFILKNGKMSTNHNAYMLADCLIKWANNSIMFMSEDDMSPEKIEAIRSADKAE